MEPRPQKKHCPVPRKCFYCGYNHDRHDRTRLKTKTADMDGWAHGKQRGFSPVAAARHSPSSPAFSFFPRSFFEMVHWQMAHLSHVTHMNEPSHAYE